MELIKHAMLGQPEYLEVLILLCAAISGNFIPCLALFLQVIQFLHQLAAHKMLWQYFGNTLWIRFAHFGNLLNSCDAKTFGTINFFHNVEPATYPSTIIATFMDYQRFAHLAITANAIKTSHKIHFLAPYVTIGKNLKGTQYMHCLGNKAYWGKKKKANLRNARVNFILP